MSPIAPDTQFSILISSSIAESYCGIQPFLPIPLAKQRISKILSSSFLPLTHFINPSPQHLRQPCVRESDKLSKDLHHSLLISKSNLLVLSLALEQNTSTAFLPHTHIPVDPTEYLLLTFLLPLATLSQPRQVLPANPAAMPVREAGMFSGPLLLHLFLRSEPQVSFPALYQNTCGSLPSPSGFHLLWAIQIFHF